MTELLRRGRGMVEPWWELGQPILGFDPLNDGDLVMSVGSSVGP